MKRLVHLRHKSVVNLGHSRTFCGRTIYSAPRDMTAAVLTFGDSRGNIDVTTDRSLANCGRCINR